MGMNRGAKESTRILEIFGFLACILCAHLPSHSRLPLTVKIKVLVHHVLSIIVTRYVHMSTLEVCKSYVVHQIRILSYQNPWKNIPGFTWRDWRVRGLYIRRCSHQEAVRWGESTRWKSIALKCCATHKVLTNTVHMFRPGGEETSLERMASYGIIWKFKWLYINMSLRFFKDLWKLSLVSMFISCHCQWSSIALAMNLSFGCFASIYMRTATRGI